MLGFIRVPDRGTHRQKDQAHLRDAVTDVMRVEQPQRPDCVSIYRAGTSGTVRTPVRFV